MPRVETADGGSIAQWLRQPRGRTFASVVESCQSIIYRYTQCIMYYTRYLCVCVSVCRVIHYNKHAEL